MDDRSADSDGIVNVDAIEYRPWTDLAAVAQLMCAHWPKPRWAYDAALLAEYLDRPRADRSLQIGAFAAGRPIGFVAGIPMRLSWAGAVRSVLFASFFTIDPDAAPPGVPIRLLRTLADAAVAAGYSHYVTVVEAQGRTKALVPALHARAGIALRSERTIHAWVGTPTALASADDGSVGGAGSVRVARAADAPAITAAIDALPATGMRQVPEPDLLAQWLGERSFSRVVERGGELLGFALARPRRVVDGHRSRTNLQVDWLVASDGVGAEPMVRDLARHAAVEAIDLMVLQDGGLLPPVGPGLLRAPNAMQLFTAPLGDAQPLPEVESAALEVF